MGKSPKVQRLITDKRLRRKMLHKRSKKTDGKPPEMLTSPTRSSSPNSLRRRRLSTRTLTDLNQHQQRPPQAHLLTKPRRSSKRKLPSQLPRPRLRKKHPRLRRPERARSDQHNRYLSIQLSHEI